MAKIQAVWALDIGQAALKALKLVPGDAPGEVRAEAFDFIEYPKILSQPDADAEELVREAMTTFLERNDLKGTSVAIGVPGQAGLVKFIKLPPVEKKRIPDIVKFEAKQQIPFALEEVIWDYQQIGGDDEDADDSFTMAEVGLFAMKRDQIHRAIQPFKNAGIEVDIVQMGPIALFNYLSYDKLGAPKAAAEGDGEAKPKKADEDKGSVVIIDIGADNTDLIISDGVRIWQRNVPIGGNHFTRALTKELKLTFAKAEHLKRNATKAPDPRSVFTAMRGVFNDFSSEINRSIGFYSSVNRKAKISRIVGMGNGFKLPGLQKFLQQNLSYEVDKLETFERLTGEEVLAAPQFVDNLPSFAVAYGLGLQGLGVSKLRTNLLPPEIEQVRMIRRKKPWALAAASLFLLGFSMLFLKDWRAWAKVNNSDFVSAVDQAKKAAETGNRLKSEYGTAKGAFEGKVTEGNSMIARVDDRGSWPALLREINNALPNPALIRFDPEDRNRLVLDPRKPGRPLDPYNRAERAIEDQNRVHVDLIAPVWKEDLNEWFEGLPEYAKNMMLAYDRATPPSGPGWVVQIVGHHYNWYTPEGTPDTLKPLYLGPTRFLTTNLLRNIGSPNYRLFGISHPTIYWIAVDEKWTSDKSAQNNALPTGVPLMTRSTAPAAGTGGEGGMGMPGYGSGGRGGMASSGMPGGMSGGGLPGGMEGGMSMPGYGSSGGRGMMPGGMMSSGMGFPGGNKKKEDPSTYLKRTDFLIQFAWVPIAPDAPMPTAEELADQRKEIEEKLLEAAKTTGAVKPLDEKELMAQAEKVRDGVEKQLLQRAQQAAKGAGSEAPAAPAAKDATPKAP